MTEERTHARAFEAFNARFLTSEEVARTFIPPPQYDRLVEIGHSVLLGPRGSGKTTLLKMLQLRALAAWQHEKASGIRQSIGYHAIFLGTDVLWGSQLESRTKDITDEEKRSQIRRTSFRLHLALAFLNALDECRDPALSTNPELCRFTYPLVDEAERTLGRGLAKLWLLDIETNSLLGLRINLRTQLSNLLSLTSELRRNPTTPLPQFADLDPVTSLLSAIDITNHVFGQPSRRWAILCDELEIAPDMVRRELFQLLRSTSHNVIFKFSLFPYSSELSTLTGPNSPSSGNDYASLELYYGRREAAYQFCEAMLKGMVAEAGGAPFQNPQDVLGDGWFDGGRLHRRLKTSPYEPPHGQFFVRAKKLTIIDPSFRHWLRDLKIDLNKVHEMPDDVQAPYRKALPYILTRCEFLRSGGKRRSRKSMTLYTGAYSLFSLTEGNPRIFINLMRPLVKNYAQTQGTVRSELEATSADLTIHRFLSSLSAIPTIGDHDIRSILQLIKVIGDFFTDAQLGSEFSSEPASTFIVDDHVPPSIVELVGRSLNAGALVHMPDNPGDTVRELRGSRLRLAYTLAPEYKLPLTSGRQITLSTILHGRSAAKQRKPETVQQARLPFGFDE